MSNRSVPTNISCHGNGVFREIDSQRRLVKRREDCLKLGVCHTHTQAQRFSGEIGVGVCFYFIFFQEPLLEAGDSGDSGIPGIYCSVGKLISLMEDA